MADLTNFIYCINAERIPSKNGKTDSVNAIGVLSSLTPEFVPGTFSFSVIFSVLDIDISGNNTVQITFFREGEQENLVDSGVITIPPLSPDSDDIQLPPKYQGLNMSMDFRNVIFEQEGLYNTKVIFNDQVLAIKPIYVKGKR
ncbi:MAG TPA: hypothetical protein IAA04_10830 [Candidatus Lachnoclostridium pullistercoris]|uniref:Uncharacterized protein n=1 Tax=Candidatus Lachnoclostridium pullistercoris TaxID=2838632 RepID=A0A9D2PD29_9FIRM|nr:hypothetical protein [Candidatus Lachnoclostridium pullistercoris]